MDRAGKSEIWTYEHEWAHESAHVWARKCPLSRPRSEHPRWCPQGLKIPPTPDRAPNPHFLKKRVSGSKKPLFPLALARPGKGSFLSKKCPFSLCSLVEKRGFFDRKLPFPGWGEGVFGPRNPLFRKPQKTRKSRVQEVIRVRSLLSSGVRKLPKHLFYCVSVQSERGGWSVTDLCWLLEPSTFGSFAFS